MRRQIVIERGMVYGEFATNSGNTLIRADDVSAVTALNNGGCVIHMISGTIFTVEFALSDVLQMMGLDACKVFEGDE